VVPRVSDVYAALPSLTGKLELEYEGELRGADAVCRDLIRTAMTRCFDRYYEGANLHNIVQWFDLGGTLQIDEHARSEAALQLLKEIHGLTECFERLGVDGEASPALQVAAGEFILEGLYAHKRISRSEKRGYYAEEKRRSAAESASSREIPPLPPRSRRPLN
jgi:magnesium chelatase subunit I